MTDKTVSQSDEYFIPIDDEQELKLPESIVETAEEIQSTKINSFSLKPRKIKYLGAFLKLFTIALLVMVGWEMISFVSEINQLHWSLGYLSAILMIGVLVFMLLAIRSYQQNQQDLDSVYQFQDNARRLINEKTFGQSKQLITDLKKLYSDKPHENLLNETLSLLPDYSNDPEVLHHLSEHFFSKLDKQAIHVTSKYSQQTGLLVALSPLAIADMLLSLWRMLKMTDEISQVYGVRPSLPGRVRLVRNLVEGMAIAGSTELISDTLTDATASSIAGVVSSRVAQGIGVGVYVNRIGFKVMDLCRPIPFTDEDKPSFSDAITEMKTVIVNLLKSRVTVS